MSKLYLLIKNIIQIQNWIISVKLHIIIFIHRKLFICKKLNNILAFLISQYNAHIKNKENTTTLFILTKLMIRELLNLYTIMFIV